jgi:hypothetical protein
MIPIRARKFRQSAFAVGLEKTFASSFRFSASNFACKKAESARLQNLDVELILPARFEET